MFSDPAAYQRRLHRAAQLLSDDDVHEDEPITALKQGLSQQDVKMYRPAGLLV
jgi:hypothetical protein